MTISPKPCPAGDTADNGRFQILGLRSGSLPLGIFDGMDRAANARVQIAHVCSSSITTEEARAKFSYHIDGITDFLFTGPLDPRPIPTCDESRILVESLPEKGMPLHTCQLPMRLSDVLQLGLELAVIVHRAQIANVWIDGLRPELIYVGLGENQVLRGVTPRAAPFLSCLAPARGPRNIMHLPFEAGVYASPEELDSGKPSKTTNTYVLGLVLAKASQGTHPFPESKDPGRDGGFQDELMRRGEGCTLTGPPELRGLLEGMLVADPKQRMPIDDVIRELDRLDQLLRG